MLGKLHHRNPRKLQCYVLEKDLTDPESPLESPEMDQLFLLPDSVLGMDSLSFREDVAAVAPDFLSTHFKNSPPHNSLDSTDSNRSSVRVLEDTEGLVFARASNGCLWLCKFILSFTHYTNIFCHNWKKLSKILVTFTFIKTFTSSDSSEKNFSDSSVPRKFFFPTKTAGRCFSFWNKVLKRVVGV